jgi:hypothetical protein
MMTYRLDDFAGVGTSLRGYVHARYFDLVKVFGEPNIRNAEEGDKVWNEWGIRFEDGDDDVYVTIYDWKEMYAKESHYGEYRWHIGGKESRCVELVYEALGR